MRAAVLALTLLYAAGPARASEGGKVHLEKASKLYDLGAFQLALEELRAAYATDDDPAILLRIAQCHEKLGERDQAARQYRAWLDRSPDAPDRARVEELLAATAPPPPAQVAPAPPPVTKPAPAETAPTDEGKPRRERWFESWWVWTGVVAVVAIAAGVTVGIVASRRSDAPIPDNTSGYTLLRFP